MAAFDDKTKGEILAQIDEFEKANLIAKDVYYDSATGKADIIGAVTKSNSYELFEKTTGCPVWLASVVDALHMALPEPRAKVFPREFIGSIRPLADLTEAKKPFTISVLELLLTKFDVDTLPVLANRVNDELVFQAKGERALYKNPESVYTGDGVNYCVQATLNAIREDNMKEMVLYAIAADNQSTLPTKGGAEVAMADRLLQVISAI